MSAGRAVVSWGAGYWRSWLTRLYRTDTPWMTGLLRPAAARRCHTSETIYTGDQTAGHRESSIYLDVPLDTGVKMGLLCRDCHGQVGLQPVGLFPAFFGDAPQLVRPRLGFLLSWQESCAVHFHTHFWVVGPPVRCGCLSSAGSSGDPADSLKFALFPWRGFSVGLWGPYSPGASHHSPYGAVCSPQERWCCGKRLVRSFSLFFYVIYTHNMHRSRVWFLSFTWSSCYKFFGFRFSFLLPFLPDSLRLPSNKMDVYKEYLDLLRAYKTPNWHSSN